MCTEKRFTLYCLATISALVYLSAGCGGSASDQAGNAAVRPESQPASRPATGSDAVDIRQSERKIVAAGLAGPVGLAVDEEGTLYVSEAELNRIVAVDSGGETRIVAARLDRPMHIAYRGGKLFVPEFGSDRIAVIDAATGRIESRIGNSSSFNAPAGVAVDDEERLYVADFYNNRVVVLSPVGKPVRTFGSKGEAPGKLNYPTDVALGPNGEVFVADAYNHRVSVFSREGRFILAWGGYGSEPGQFKIAQGIDIASDGSVLVTDAENNRVQRFDGSGGWIETFDALDYPVEVTASEQGEFLVVLNHRGEIAVRAYLQSPAAPQEIR